MKTILGLRFHNLCANIKSTLTFWNRLFLLKHNGYTSDTNGGVINMLRILPVIWIYQLTGHHKEIQKLLFRALRLS